MKLLKILAFLFIFCSSFLQINAFADNNSSKPIIKIAVLDNLLDEKYSSDNYVGYYLAGIEAAVAKAKMEGFNVQFKAFFYGKKPLAILNELNKVEAWKPDLIIGPRTSDNFLLLQNQLKNILVLSPLATATDVYKMPNNFYSLTPSNMYSAQAMANFIDQRFPNKGVFSVAEVDCKSCADISTLFIHYYQSLHHDAKVKEASFIGSEAETLNIANLMAGYKKGQVILLPNQSSASGVLMARISDYLQQHNTIFIGGDDWGSWSVGDPGRIKSNYSFLGYRICPWSVEGDLPELIKFRQFYQKTYHTLPPDSITYIMYTTVRAPFAALKKFGKAKLDQKTIRTEILVCFQQALSNDPNWFRPKKYNVFEINSNEEKLIGNISSAKYSITS